MSIYKKVKKENDNYFGVEQISEDDNPFKKPCLISLAALRTLKENNGIMTGAMRFARVRTKKDNASRVLIENMNVNFLTQEYENKKPNIDTDILPYLDKILTPQPSIEDLKKCFRNINLLSYCNGDNRVNKTIQSIRTRLENSGYSSNDVNSILKNVVVFSFAKNSNIDPAVSSYTFMDILDEETSYAIPAELKKSTYQSLENGNLDGLHIEKNGNQTKICFIGTGKHTNDYMENSGVIPCVVASLVTRAIENSRANHTSKQFIPYSPIEELQVIGDILTRFQNEEKQEDIIASIDKEVYKDIPRADDLELYLTKKIDDISQKLSNINLGEEYLKREDYRNNMGRFLLIASKILSKEQMEYITHGRNIKISETEIERLLSDEGRQQLIFALEDIGAVHKEDEKGTEIKDIDLTFLDTLSEQPPKAQTIRDMINLKKKQLDAYNQNSKDIHQDSVIMNGIISRLIEIGSDKDLAQILLKFDKDILYTQFPLPEEDKILITEFNKDSHDQR